jgi:Pyruvate/2-oxoacid:ferredoxin oxidoreductase gamma subunit
MANELGDTRAANLIMLGAYVAYRRSVQPEQIEDGVRDALSAKGASLVELNIGAFRTGMHFAEQADSAR